MSKLFNVSSKAPTRISVAWGNRSRFANAQRACAEGFASDFLAGHGDRELAFETHDQLERVDRIETETVAE